MKKIIFIMLACVSVNSYSTVYWQFVDGGYKTINESRFATCSKKFFRKPGKNGLSKLNKKKMVKAVLKGEMKNDIGALKKSMAQVNGSCSYTDDSEKIMI